MIRGSFRIYNGLNKACKVTQHRKKLCWALFTQTLHWNVFWSTRKQNGTTRSFL